MHDHDEADRTGGRKVEMAHTNRPPHSPAHVPDLPRGIEPVVASGASTSLTIRSIFVPTLRARFAAKRAAAMDIDTPTQDRSDPLEDFADILEFTLASTLPANPEDPPETRARKLAAARRQFAAF